MYNTEQFQAARRIQVEALLGISGKAFEGVERLVTLNLRTTKAALNDASQASIAALGARDVKSLIESQAGVVSPVAERVSAYSRDVAEIVSSTGAELSRLTKASVGELQRQVMTAFQGAAQTLQSRASSVEPVVAAAEASKDAVTETLEKAADEGAAATASAAEAVTEPSVIVPAEAPPVKSAPKSKRASSSAE